MAAKARERRIVRVRRSPAASPLALPRPMYCQLTNSKSGKVQHLAPRIARRKEEFEACRGSKVMQNCCHDLRIEPAVDEAIGPCICSDGPRDEFHRNKPSMQFEAQSIDLPCPPHPSTTIPALACRRIVFFCTAGQFRQRFRTKVYVESISYVRDEIIIRR